MANSAPKQAAAAGDGSEWVAGQLGWMLQNDSDPAGIVAPGRTALIPGAAATLLARGFTGHSCASLRAGEVKATKLTLFTGEPSYTRLHISFGYRCLDVLCETVATAGKDYLYLYGR